MVLLRVQVHFFFQGHKKLRLPHKMDMLKFIGGRRSKCIFLNLNIEKNAFRLHEEQNGTNDNFGDGETGVLRVYIYIHTPSGTENMEMEHIYHL
jgi:hypothetical protein